MIYSALLAFTLLVGANTSNNKNVSTAPSTYLLQVSSNLNCALIEIDILSQSGGAESKLAFTQKAFAATNLSEGAYTFGTITCHDSPRGTQTFDFLKNNVGSFELQAGQAYFGGKLILMEQNQGPDSTAPDVLENCVRTISRARGDENTGCRDGTGVETSRRGQRFVNAYVPRLDKEEIERIRNALSLTEEELIYLPINTPSH